MSTPPVRYDNRLLRLNVGFLLKENVGYTREIDIEQTEPVRIDDIIINQMIGSLRLTRARQGVVVQGMLRNRSTVSCVRCLTEFEMPYEIEISELFVYPAPIPPDPQNPNTVDEGGFIDLSPIVREEGLLAVPMQALCRSDCKGLCPQCGTNWNEATCDCATDDIDPRLEALRSLFKN